ncbi:methyltransferase [Devosia yakushimensis]|uniref:Methyltransferase n=1 Tax=Devosia yakushimensis TaxID=470028 RepID=A0ABQ5UFC8_9HYPH|nr:methyltransferase [Devosia yakushimensis]
MGGRITLSQPRQGFRAGLDSVLLGAAVAEDCERLLDLGSGVGTAAFVALAHAPACHGTLVEQNPEMAALARDNAATNGFAARTLVIEADVTAKGGDRKAAGLIENGYDSVIANPPFFEAGAGTLATTTGRAAARHMDAAALDLWVRTAATSAAANGEVIFIYPVESLAPLLAAFSQRFGGLTLLPLAPRPDAPANRVLLRGLKGSRAPLRMLASRALHDAEGRAFRPEFDAIFRGIARLDW